MLKSGNDQIRGADIGDCRNLSSHGRREGKKRRTCGEVGENEKRNGAKDKDKERAKKEGAVMKKKKEQEDENWRNIKRNVTRCRMLTGGITRLHFSKSTRGLKTLMKSISVVEIVMKNRYS